MTKHLRNLKTGKNFIIDGLCQIFGDTPCFTKSKDRSHTNNVRNFDFVLFMGCRCPFRSTAGLFFRTCQKYLEIPDV